MHTTLTGPELPLQTCARRLAPLGVTAEPSATETGGLTLRWPRAAGPVPRDVDCAISWYGPAKVEPDRPGSEAAVQALCGLMGVNGRDLGRPRPIGVEIASVAAGVLAAEGLLAAMIGASRGRPVAQVQTSVLQAGLMLLSHYVAAATCCDDWMPITGGPDPGPPFATSDGHWFEIETLDPEAWRSFWLRLGATDADLGRGWTVFRSRYYRGTCTLPTGFHQATARHTAAEAAEAAAACGVSLCRVRSYAEVLFDPGRAESHPVIVPLLARSAGRGPLPQPHLPGPSDDLPLGGLRVVEATSRMQGPLAGLLLSMLGAEVIRVEPPGGDVGRMVPPMAGDTGSFFLSFNRGKHSVEADLSTTEGRAAVFDMAADADVFLNNWRPGKASEWGLDWESLSPRNPRLVYCQASGWGERPGSFGLVGTDFLVQAYAGLGDGLTPEGEWPAPSRVLLTDFMGALVTCEGILGGLFLRERTGLGSRVGTSLLAGAMTLQAHVLHGLAIGEEHRRWGGRPVWGPLDRLVDAADGLLAVTVEDDRALRQLCELCGVDPDASSERAAVEQLVAERMGARAASEWEELLSRHRIPCAPVCPDEELVSLPADPRFSELFETLAGTCRAPASPWRLC